MAKLCPLFSGSSGNSYYIGSGGEGILVDAGRSAKQLEGALRENELDIKSIRAIFVTHEHSDHIQGLRVLASRYQIPVYSSQGTLEALCDMEVLNGKYPAYVAEEKGICVGGMCVVPFRTSHDARESVGYCVHTADGRKAVIATDLGYITPNVRQSVKGADVAVLESNHDVGMLQNGSYPYPLKRRILSKSGHLSNTACAQELSGFVLSGTRRFVLAHLSDENNLPQLAYQTSLCCLTQCGMKEGVDFKLLVASRECTGMAVVY